jgi:hypothetical protein
VAAALAEITQHEPEHCLVEIGAGRMFGSFAGAQDVRASGRLLEHRYLAGTTAEVVNGYPLTVAQ